MRPCFPVIIKVSLVLPCIIITIIVTLINGGHENLTEKEKAAKIK